MTERIINHQKEQKTEVVMEGIMGPVSIPVEKTQTPEIPSQTASKDTLRAHEVAELDPYGVRSKPSKPIKVEHSPIPELEVIDGRHLHGSSRLMVAEVLKEKGYGGIIITQVPGEEFKQIRIKKERAQQKFEELCELPDLKLLEEITDPKPFSQPPDLSKRGEFYEFDNIVNQRRLKALYYQAKIKHLKEASQHFKIPLEDGKVVIYEALIDENLRSYPGTSFEALVNKREKIPSRAEVKHWVKQIVMQNL